MNQATRLLLATAALAGLGALSACTTEAPSEGPALLETSSLALTECSPGDRAVCEGGDECLPLADGRGVCAGETCTLSEDCDVGYVCRRDRCIHVAPPPDRDTCPRGSIRGVVACGAGYAAQVVSDGPVCSVCEERPDDCFYPDGSDDRDPDGRDCRPCGDDRPEGCDPCIHYEELLRRCELNYLEPDGMGSDGGRDGEPDPPIGMECNDEELSELYRLRGICEPPPSTEPDCWSTAERILEECHARGEGDMECESLYRAIIRECEGMDPTDPPGDDCDRVANVAFEDCVSSGRDDMRCEITRDETFRACVDGIAPDGRP